MSYIPNCREDDTYNEKYLTDNNAAYVAGFDWAVAELNNAAENYEALGSNIEDISESSKVQYEWVMQELTGEDLYWILSNRPDLRNWLWNLLNNWVELGRDELITSMIDDMSESEYAEVKAIVDNKGWKNPVLLQQEEIGTPFGEAEGTEEESNVENEKGNGLMMKEQTDEDCERGQICE